MKKLLAALAALPLLLSLFACQGGPKPLDLSYETPDGKKVTVRQVEPTKEKPMMYYSWVETSELKIYDLVDLVAKGKISNIREIEVSYESPGTEDADRKFYATLFDFTFYETYFKKSEPGNTITVYYSVASYNFPTDDEGSIYEISDLKEEGIYYLLFKRVQDSYENSFEINRVADYVLLYPQSFLIPEDSAEEYLKRKFEVYRSEKNSNGIVEKYADMDSFTIREYENFLKEYFK